MRALVLLVPLLLGGCDLLSADRFHCQATIGEQFSNCLEFYDFQDSIGGQQIRLSIAGFCSSTGFSEAQPGGCPTEGRIGACREIDDFYVKEAWSYEGGPNETIDDLNCTSQETLIGPDGEPYDPSPPTDPGSDPICSPTDPGTGTQVTVTNPGARPVTVYWGGFDCSEQLMGVVQGGDSLPITTTVGHVFRVRAGERVTDALVLLDFTAEADGAYEASW